MLRVVPNARKGFTKDPPCQMRSITPRPVHASPLARPTEKRRCSWGWRRSKSAPMTVRKIEFVEFVEFVYFVEFVDFAVIGGSPECAEPAAHARAWAASADSGERPGWRTAAVRGEPATG